MHMVFSCSKCGTDMEFDEDTGRLICPACHFKEQVDGYQKDFVAYRPVRIKEVYGDEEARLYVCKKCGMELVTDNQSSETTCYFCGSAMSTGQRISGEIRPAKLLPFAVRKKQAEKSFAKWYWKLKLSPKEFRGKRKDCRLHAMYLPVWMFDLRGQGEAEIHAANQKKAEDEEDHEKYMEITHYDLYRRFDLGFEHILINASSKIDARFLDALEPYDLSKLQEFHPYERFDHPAEKYSCIDKEIEEEAKRKIKESIDEYVLKTIRGYEECHIVDREYQIGVSRSEYIWLPIWFVCLDRTDPDYMFVMNGQTGRVAFDPPYSLAKLLVTGGLFVTFLFVLIRLAVFLAGGPLLY